MTVRGGTIMELRSKFAEWLKKNPWLGPLSFLFALIGVVLTIISLILFLASMRTKETTCAVQGTNLIQDFTSRFEALEITYAGKRIANFTATKVVFWNSGKGTIDGAKIVRKDPLKIRVKDGYKILDSDVLHPKEDDNPNQFKRIPSEDGTHVLIEFDYLEEGEGGVVQLLHTGKSSDDVEVCGRIKEAGKPKRRWVPSPSSLAYRTPWWWNSTIFFLFPSTFLLLVYVITFRSINIFTKVLLLKWLLIGSAISVFVLYWGIGYLIIFKKYVPKGFEIFFEEVSNSLK
jgi:hypothetical protein